VLEPRVAAEIANETGYSSPNLAARSFIRREFLDNPAIYPPREVLERCQYIEAIGDAIEVYDRFWTEIKSK
jgi:spermidine/putrescine-binding protein